MKISEKQMQLIIKSLEELSTVYITEFSEDISKEQIKLLEYLKQLKNK
jgi:hypothetical protein